MLQTEIRKYGSVTVYLLFLDNFIRENHLDQLLPEEIEKLNTIHHPKKKDEYVAVRALRTKYFGNKLICYSEIGAPYLENQGYISISHADCAVGIAYCEDFMVGLDLEPIRDLVLRVKNKFLSEKEKQENDINSIETLIKIWSGKEALYKLAERKKIIFATQLALTQTNDLIWKGEMIFSDSHQEVELVIDKKDNFVISVNRKPKYEINK